MPENGKMFVTPGSLQGLRLLREPDPNRKKDAADGRLVMGQGELNGKERNSTLRSCNDLFKLLASPFDSLGLLH